MPPRALDLQETALRYAKRSGDAETFLRHTVALAIGFEGARLGPASETGRMELAVRVLRDGREGVAGGSLPQSVEATHELVEQSERLAIRGRKIDFLNVEFSDVDLPQDAWMTEPQPSEVIEMARVLLSHLENFWAAYLWSGTVEQSCTRFRVRNGAGLIAAEVRSVFRVSLRARRGGNLPVDRLFEVQSQSWTDVLNGLMCRLEGELPHDPSVATFPNEVYLALGAGVFAHVLEAIPIRARLTSAFPFHPSLFMSDHPTGVFDEEGVRSHTLSVIANGQPLPPWITVGSRAGRPTGRAYRPAVEDSPRLRASSLRWDRPIVTWPKRTVLVPEIAALTLRDDGILVGTPVEGVILEDGHPIARCRMPALRMQLHELLGCRMVGGTGTPMLADRHRLPALIVN